MKSHIERSHYTLEYINPEQPTPRHTVVKLLDYKGKKLATQAKINWRRLDYHQHQCFMPGKKMYYIFKISKKRKQEPRILYTAKRTLGLKGKDKLLSAHKDSENMVSIIFKRTCNNQNDYRDLNRSTGSEQKWLLAELRLNKD